MKNMRLFTAFTLVFAILSWSLPAAAKDSRHMVCAGYGDSKPAPDNYGLVLIIDNTRAKNGVDYTETVSTIWLGEHLFGTNTKDSSEFAKDGHVILLSNTDESRVYFEGIYQLVPDKKNPRLRVIGRRWLTPGDMKTAEKVDTLLNCIDYSN